MTLAAEKADVEYTRARTAAEQAAVEESRARALSSQASALRTLLDVRSSHGFVFDSERAVRAVVAGDLSLLIDEDDELIS